jgi:hypothetical protein
MKSDQSMGGGGGWTSAAKDGEAIPAAKARPRNRLLIIVRSMMSLLKVSDPQ